MDLMSTAQLLGNVGEFFGAIAVVGTLAYPAIQVRQNTAAQKTTHAAAEQATRATVTQEFADLRMRIAESDYLSQVYLKVLINKHCKRTSLERSSSDSTA